MTSTCFVVFTSTPKGHLIVILTQIHDKWGVSIKQETTPDFGRPRDEFVNHDPQTSDLQILRVFFQLWKGKSMESKYW